MKLVSLVVLAFILQSNYSYSQCGSGLDLTLTSQKEVDEFLLNYCKEFDGHLRIKDNSDSLIRIVDLSPLLGLKSVYGIFQISCNSLLNLYGLDSLESVGSLRLHSNENLVNISSFTKLKYTFGDFWIAGNKRLKNLTEFSNLIQVDGYLRIQYNDSLNNIDALAKLKSTIGILIAGNNQLLNLNGINNILPNSIIDNPLNTHEININNNDILSVCSNNFICEVIKRTDLKFKIEDNNINCNSLDEISNNCLTSLEAFQVDKTISINPNPTFHQLTFELAKPEILYIYDSLGNMTDKISLNSGYHEIDISTKKQGLYFINFSNYKVVKIMKL